MSGPSTKRYRFRLHREPNEKLEQMAKEFETSPFNQAFGPFDRSKDFPLGIVASGAAFGTAKEVLQDLGVLEEVPLLKVGGPLALPATIDRRLRRLL